jgi:hypothetical protein
MFAIIPRNLSPEVKRVEIPTEVEFLIEFKEFISKEFPEGLPPIRSISHEKGFIPGSSLPNKSPHMMTTAKNVVSPHY